jgi:hypothetical protein
MKEQESTRGDRKPDDSLPGSVSDQNAEESEPGHGGGSGAGGGSEDGSGAKREGASGGESKEGSQSTGHPDSAG